MTEDPPAAGRVLVIGDVMSDVIVRPRGPLVRGADRRAAIATRPGGSGANQAAWLGHLGVPVAFAARIGAADLAACRAEMAGHGVRPFLAADPARATGAIVTMVDPDGERSFLTDRGANEALEAADLPDALLDGVRLLHVSGYSLFAAGPREAVLGLVARAGARGIAWSVDPASASFLAEVGAGAFLGWTAGASFCFPNADEAALLAGTPDPARQHAVLRARYGCTLIKRGPAGAEAVTADRLVHQPAGAVRVVDTTGAGDAFLAAFLAATLRGRPLDEALAAAVRAGSAATATVGGRPPTAIGLRRPARP